MINGYNLPREAMIRRKDETDKYNVLHLDEDATAKRLKNRLAVIINMSIIKSMLPRSKESLKGKEYKTIIKAKRRSLGGKSIR